MTLSLYLFLFVVVLIGTAIAAGPMALFGAIVASMLAVQIMDESVVDDAGGEPDGE